MKTPSRRAALTASAALLIIVTASPSALADGPYRNRDNPNIYDLSEGTYPIPYQLPQIEEITAVLERVHGYLSVASPTRIVNRTTGREIPDLTTPVADAVADRGEAGAFNVLDYTMGVTHSGLLLASEATGDTRYRDLTARHMQFIAEALPYFRAQAKQFGAARNSFGAIIATDSLDDSGSMCAALIKARRASVGPDLLPVIEHWANYVDKEQFRLDDGTLARRRPQPVSLWADDFYMSVPALAQMGALTGDSRYIDHAARQVLGFAKHLFNHDVGLYMHGRNFNQPDNPEFYWSRANGWTVMGTVELLDVMPEDHPARPEILRVFRAHLKSLAQLQSGNGLWHQMLDKPDSYPETSGTAMFVYGLARAINRGWISPVSYGSVAQAGWIAVAQQVNARGQVEGTCVGTTFASDNVYYYNRPASPYATHGYGPVLLAGAEMIRLLQNPKIDIQAKLRTYHYVPKTP